MQTGYRDIPHWMMSVIPMLFVLLIVAGGLWFRAMDRRAREAAARNRDGETGPEA